jgi:uncharacterized Zn finger protein
MNEAARQGLLDALSDSALKTGSKAAIFKRGQAYAQSGAVQAVEQEDGPVPAARATVVGAQP